MAEETDPTETLSEAAAAIADAAANLSALTTSMQESPGFFSLGQVSFGALIGSIVGALIAFFVRRKFAKADEKELAQHRRKETAIELHDRFNSSEVLKARADAENFLLEHVGEKFQDIHGEDTRINSVWLVAREYEFMSIAISEKLADGDIVAKAKSLLTVTLLPSTHSKSSSTGCSTSDTDSRMRDSTRSRESRSLKSFSRSTHQQKIDGRRWRKSSVVISIVS